MKQLYIDGAWSDGILRRTWSVTNPATGEHLEEVAVASAEDVDRAVGAARRAFDEGPWPRMDPLARGHMLQQLANLPRHPESVPINMLVRVPGTPLENEADLDPFEFIRTIAVARIMMPASHVRLSAGREAMNEQMHALAYFSGANSIFYGEKLLTTPNPQANTDMALFQRLGIAPERRQVEKPPQTPSPMFYDAAST